MTIEQSSAAASLVLDARALDSLKTKAKSAPDQALRQAASQFEALFMNMLLKSMRESLGQDGPFDSDATRTYTAMLDQQLAQKAADRGVGLADMIVKQLSRAAPDGAAAPVPGAIDKVRRATEPAAAGGAPQSFVDRMLPHARAAETATGVPARFILGQAALESGWGKHEIRGAGGAASHNLFGIKAGRGWAGKTVDVVTTEYVDGAPRKLVQKFRAYASYEEGFRDWARLMAGSPRYAAVIAESRDAAEYARRMQSAGYATDPAYADKLTRVINHQLLRRALA